jgi:hypothetical protein
VIREVLVVSLRKEPRLLYGFPNSFVARMLDVPAPAGTGAPSNFMH